MLKATVLYRIVVLSIIKIESSTDLGVNAVHAQTNFPHAQGMQCRKSGALAT